MPRPGCETVAHRPSSCERLGTSSRAVHNVVAHLFVSALAFWRHGRRDSRGSGRMKLGRRAQSASTTCITEISTGTKPRELFSHGCLGGGQPNNIPSLVCLPCAPLLLLLYPSIHTPDNWGLANFAGDGSQCHLGGVLQKRRGRRSVRRHSSALASQVIDLCTSHAASHSRRLGHASTKGNMKACATACHFMIRCSAQSSHIPNALSGSKRAERAVS